MSYRPQFATFILEQWERNYPEQTAQLKEKRWLDKSAVHSANEAIGCVSDLLKQGMTFHDAELASEIFWKRSPSINQEPKPDNDVELFRGELERLNGQVGRAHALASLERKKAKK